MQWKTFRHPAYSLDFLLCHFHIFGPVNKALKGSILTADSNVHIGCGTVKQQPKEFFADGIH
jgi:hypothetical protein